MPTPTLDAAAARLASAGQYLPIPTTTAIDDRYAQLGGPDGFLGAPASAEEAIPGGRRRAYANGHLYWSALTGACAVHGPVLQRYLQLGGASGFLGFPTTDVLDGARSGSTVGRFVGGGIWWSAQTGARAVHGDILRKYLMLGGEGGLLGLPTSDEVNQAPGGKRSRFQGGVILWHPGTGAHEVHGAILERYTALGGSAGFLGFPVSDESDAGAPGATAGKLSCFAGGAIYWSPATGAWEVHGAIRERYEALGGPASEFGYPTTNETATGQRGACYNGFQHGVIGWAPACGVVAVRELELYLGWVKSGPVDDGLGDSSAELVTYTTVRANGHTLESGMRRPGGHAGTSHELGARYAITDVRPGTAVSFEIRCDDWDEHSDDEYLGTFRRTLDVATLWGMAEDGQGVFTGVPLSQRGGDAPGLGSLTLDFAVRATRPSPLDPTKTFREQCWWRFENFSTPSLTTQQYADTFRDVGHRTNWVEKAIHPWDSLFYLAYEGIAAKGNCFGMSLEGALAQRCRSVYGEPVYRFGFDAGVRAAFNQKHAYQIGDASVRWTLGKLATLDAVRPACVYENVRAALARRDPPLVSMFDLDGFRGHTVLAYECVPAAAGRPLVIRVADPNHPYVPGGPEHPTYIEIDPAADTFKFVTPDGTRYQSTRIVAGLLPGTLMFETPLSQVAGQPRTPYWEFTALLAALGGVVVLAGDATVDQLTADGTPLYGAGAGGPAVAPGGARGWMRLPLLDHGDAAPPQLFANTTQATGRLEFALRGRGAGGCRQYVRTPRHAVLLEAPTSAGRASTFRVLRGGAAPVRAELDTAEGELEVTLGVGTVLDAGRGDSTGALARLGAAAGATAFAQALADGSGVVLRSAGAARPVELEFARASAGRVRRVALTLPAGAAGEAVMVRPADVVSPLGEMHVWRVGADGLPLEPAPTRVQPRVLDEPVGPIIRLPR